MTNAETQMTNDERRMTGGKSMSAKELNDLGVAAAQARQLREAAEFFRQATVADAGFALAHENLATSLSEQAAALFGSFAALDIPEGGKIDLADAKLKYASLFGHMLWMGLGAAAVFLLLSPLIKRWMHGVK